MRRALAAVRLTRPDSSLLAFLAVFLPLLARTSDAAGSFKRALPLLFIAMCTFIVNDLDDLEKDKKNHPDRPLPSGDVAPVFVVSFYFICLALALATTKHLVATPVAFWYYLLLTFSISYGYIVEFLPALKSPYVAAATAIPVLIVVGFYPEETSLYNVATACSLFNLGRELCMDVCDRPGDPVSLLHQIDPELVSRVAFGLQAAGVAVVAPAADGPTDLLMLASMTTVLAAAWRYWFVLERPSVAIALMKVVLFLGLAFLF